MTLISAIGNRVISKLGGKTFIKDTLGDGSTLMKVLDSNGRTIAERAKKITKDIIGDKKVITRKEARKVYQYSSKANPKGSAVWGFKNELNKVYDKKGTFLGIKTKEWEPQSRTILCGVNPLTLVKNNPVYEFKGNVNEFFKNSLDGTIKRFDDVYGTVTHAADMSISKSEMTNLGFNKSLKRPQEVLLGDSSKTHYTEFFKGKPTHNEKGLPMPARNNTMNEEILDYDKMKNMSLEEMRRYWLEATGGTTYYTHVDGLKHLEDINDLVMKDLKDTTKPISDLSDFI